MNKAAMNKPITWTIAGSDSGSGAGIQADLLAMHALGCHPCTVITALTAQNSYEVRAVQYASPEVLQEQITALKVDLPPRAIKIGMLGHRSVMEIVHAQLKDMQIPIVVDPVMVTSSGASLLEADAQDYLIERIIPLATVITPNLAEASRLVGYTIQTCQQMEHAAQQLLTLGCKSVLLKGGHAHGSFSQDFWTNGKQKFWLNGARYDHPHNHGSGCTLASAIAAGLAHGYRLEDALVIAKMYVTQGIRLAQPLGKGPGPVAQTTHFLQQQDFIDLPWISFDAQQPRYSFPRLDTLGFYPIVSNVAWLKRLLACGVKTIQLRNKDLSGAALQQEIATAVALAKQYNAQLFINDHWQLALECQAFGVHLGQEDLLTADLAALQQAGIYLGISTHNAYEVAVAHAIQPSYIAVGPVFSTTSKNMAHAPQGLQQLAYWCKLLPYPVVAIGGIYLEQLDDVLTCKPKGVAVISAITQASNVEQTVATWLDRCQSLN